MSLRRREKFIEFRKRAREKSLGTYCGKGPKDKYKKFNYPNFYLAIKTCEELRLKNDRQTNNPLHVYQCGSCGGIHIGHLGAEESILMMGAEAINIRELQNGMASQSEQSK